MMFQTSALQAAGSQTADDLAKPGTVKVTGEDGVIYLTTETEEGETPSKTLFDQLAGREFELPTGFAADIGILINSVLSFVMVLVALLVFFYLIMGGFQWITSGGDKGKIDAARQKLIAAVVGAILVASSYAVLILVLNFLGFADLNELFGNIQPIDGSESVRVASPTPTPAPTLKPSLYSDDLGELNTY